MSCRLTHPAGRKNSALLSAFARHKSITPVGSSGGHSTELDTALTSFGTVRNDFCSAAPLLLLPSAGKTQSRQSKN